MFTSKILCAKVTFAIHPTIGSEHLFLISLPIYGWPTISAIMMKIFSAGSVMMCHRKEEI